MSERDPVAVAVEALANDRPWEARDRLAGVLGHRPDDLNVQALLGDAWWRLGDAARAGRYWFLTERSGPEVDEAVAAWASTARPAVTRARVLRVRADVRRHYSAVAQQRLSILVEQVAAEGATWEPGQSVKVPGGRLPSEKNDSRLGDALGVLAGIGLMLATVGVWLVGLIALVRLLLG